MQRYFIEVAYKGTAYKGFQIQPNHNTIQGELQKALQVLYKQPLELSGSSRTDSGVHALQNFFQLDTEIFILPKIVYNLNALLPLDIVVKSITTVSADSHCRFSAISRKYSYHIFNSKNPFLQDRAYYFPYKINISLLQQAADLLLIYKDYTSFSKRNTQVFTHICNIQSAQWHQTPDELVFTVQGNRFLRGMVRGLTGTMLKVGRGIISIEDFKLIIESKDCSNSDFSVPPQGLFLEAVNYPEAVWKPIL